MNRIDEKFRELRNKGKRAFISYIAAGDPDIKATEGIVKELSRKGADIIELGIPFSDPMADGPTIQKASHRALENGCKVRDIFSMVKNVRADVDTPLVFMTYYNIILSYGPEKFIKDSVRAGVDGLIVPDLPMEETGELAGTASREGLCLILLTAPTTSPERFSKIAALSGGFVYYVSLTGVTGARAELSLSLNGDIEKLKRLTDKPICVGFGVSTPAQAKQLARSADGVIVGSAIIRVLEKNLSSRGKMIKAVGRFASKLANAVHSVKV